MVAMENMSDKIAVRLLCWLFMGHVLALNTWSTMSLHCLPSLGSINQIGSGRYDARGMAYRFILHYMAKFSRCVLSNLGVPLFT